MNATVRNIIILCAAVALWAVPGAAQQETMRLAPGKVYLSAGFSVAFDDNVGLNDPNDERSDILLEANVGLRYLVPFAQRHSFSIEGLLAGHKGWDQSALDGLDGSLAANLDFAFDRFTLNVHEHFRRSIVPSGRDPLDWQEPADDLRKYSNTVGFVALMDLGRMSVGLGYDRVIRVAEDYTFKMGSRTYDSPYIELEVKTGQASSVFARYSYERSDSYRSTFNNSESNRIEVGMQGRVSPNLSGRFALGYEDMSFDDNGTAVVDNKDYEGIVLNGSLTHRITPLTNQSFSLTYGPENAYATGNFYEWLMFGYRLTHRFTSQFSMSAKYEFGRAEDSLYLVAPQGARSIFRSVGLGGDYQLSNASRFFFSYDYNWQSSSAYDENFDQHVVKAGLQWNF